MIDWLRSLFCSHQWKLLQKKMIYGDYLNPYNRDVLDKPEYYLRTEMTYLCEKCFKTKRIDV